MGLFRTTYRDKRGQLKKSPNWYIDYYANGRRVREKVGPSRRAAEQALRARLGEVVQGRFHLEQKAHVPRLKDFAKDYMELHAKPNKRSWSSDENSLKHLLPVFGGKRLSEITTWQIEKYKVKRAKDVSHASVNRELACLKVIFSKAVEWGKFSGNPARNVKLFREERRRERFLSPEECQRLLSECASHLRPIVALALVTGMRRGEILSLEWEDVDLARGIVTVCAEKSKSRKARDIFVGTRLTEFLRAAKDNGRYVFKGPKGDPIRSVKTAFNAASRRAGLQRLRFHDLRHTAASLMLQGTDPATVKAVLGHHSIEMTDRYLHTTESLQREAIGRLSDVILQSDGQNMVKVEGHHQEPIRLSDSN